MRIRTSRSSANDDAAVTLSFLIHKADRRASMIEGLPLCVKGRGERHSSQPEVRVTRPFLQQWPRGPALLPGLAATVHPALPQPPDCVCRPHGHRCKHRHPTCIPGRQTTLRFVSAYRFLYRGENRADSRPEATLTRACGNMPTTTKTEYGENRA